MAKSSFSSSLRWVARFMLPCIVVWQAAPSALAAKVSLETYRRTPHSVAPPPPPDVKGLSDAQMKGIVGRGHRSAQLCGMLPWHRNLRGVNLCTGDLFRSFTDLQAQGGIGGGLTLSRSYNSDDDREGPFGWGWTDNYDIRLEEQVTDPHDHTVGGDMLRSDASGARHAYHRDADGLYTPPPYLHKTLAGSTDSSVSDGPNTYTETGQDGSTEYFIADPTDTDLHHFVLSYRVDRHGNRTDYTYVTSGNGTAARYLLTQVKVSHASYSSADRFLKFTWTNETITGDSNPHYRVTQIDGPYHSSGDTPTFSVRYAYDSQAQLSAVYPDKTDATSTASSSRATTYTYTTKYQNGSGTSDLVTSQEPRLLDSVTDALGHRVCYGYILKDVASASDSTAVPTPTGTYWVRDVWEPASDAGTVTQCGWHIDFQYSHLSDDGVASTWCTQYAVPSHAGVSDTTAIASVVTHSAIEDQPFNLWLEYDGYLRMVEMEYGSPHVTGDQGPFGGSGSGSFNYANVYDDKFNVSIHTEFFMPTEWSYTALSGGGLWKTTRRVYGANGEVEEEFSGNAHSDHILPTVKYSYPTDRAATYYQPSSVMQVTNVTLSTASGSEDEPLAGTETGNTSTFVYGQSNDAFSGNKGNLLETTDAAGNVHTCRYRADGQKDWEVEGLAVRPSGGSTAWTRINARTITQGGVSGSREVYTKYGYDGYGYLNSAVQDCAKSSITAPASDPALPTEPSPSALNRSTSMTYNIAGQLGGSTDPMSHSTTYAYNGVGQPSSVTHPDETISYTYSANGRLKTTTDSNRVISLAYEGDASGGADASGGNDRVRSVVVKTIGGTELTRVNYQYRLSGDRASMAFSTNGSTTMKTWNYHYADEPDLSDWAHIGLPQDDPNSISGLLKTVTDDQGRGAEYVLNENGAVSCVRFNEVWVDYDATTGTPHTNTDGSYKLTTVKPTVPDPAYKYYYPVRYCETGYWCNGASLYTQTSGNGDTLTRVHQLNGIVTTNYVYANSDTPDPGVVTSKLLSEVDYDYDYACRKTAARFTDESGAQRTEKYGHTSGGTTYAGYDALNRLKDVDYGDGTVQDYTFDGTGNRASKSVTASGATTTENYAYNAANMLESRGSQAYTHDANGNTLTDGARTMAWDDQNRMTSCTVGGNATTFQYGPDGLRRQMAKGSTTTQYVLDGQGVIESNAVTGSTTVTKDYFSGPSGPLYERTDSNAPVWHVYDGHGNVIATMDGSTATQGGTATDALSGPTEAQKRAAASDVTGTSAYDVYGAVRVPTGTTSARHGYCGSLGHVADDETGGLVYMRARYYDPQVGRFVSEDPSLQGGNWFEYANDDPLNMHDEDGKSVKIDKEQAMVLATSGLWMSIVALFCPAFRVFLSGSIGYALAVLGVTALGLAVPFFVTTNGDLMGSFVGDISLALSEDVVAASPIAQETLFFQGYASFLAFMIDIVDIEVMNA